MQIKSRLAEVLSSFQLVLHWLESINGLRFFLMPLVLSPVSVFRRQHSLAETAGWQNGNFVGGYFLCFKVNDERSCLLLFPRFFAHISSFGFSISASKDHRLRVVIRWGILSHGSECVITVTITMVSTRARWEHDPPRHPTFRYDTARILSYDLWNVWGA